MYLHFQTVLLKHPKSFVQKIFIEQLCQTWWYIFIEQDEQQGFHFIWKGQAIMQLSGVGGSTLEKVIKEGFIEELRFKE